MASKMFEAQDSTNITTMLHRTCPRNCEARAVVSMDGCGYVRFIIWASSLQSLAVDLVGAAPSHEDVRQKFDS